MPKNTALIMIDMQKGFLNPESAQCIPMAQATVPACAKVLDWCHEKDLPVFYVTRRYRANGSDVENTRYSAWAAGGRAMSPDCPEVISAAYPDEFPVTEKDYHIIKPRFSAFFGTELDLILRRLRVDIVILAGTTTPNCIRATCYDAISLDYTPVVLSDCTSSKTAEIQRANLLDMENIGARILTSEELMAGAELHNISEEVRDSVCGR